MEKTRDVASSVVETVENAASSVAQTAQSAASQVGRTASDAASAVGHGVSTGAGYVRDTAVDATDNLSHLIRRHPYPSLLMAFAIGFLAAQATRRR
jgi:ElaB/YqjD/DUF883 family membrane-anchored ribosome-binding protein